MYKIYYEFKTAILIDKQRVGLYYIFNANFTIKIAN